MKIIVNKEPVQDVECGFYNDYEISAEFTASEEAMAQDLSNMVFDAMMLEGYLPYSIIKALLETAQDKASWFDIDFYSILKEIGALETGLKDTDSNE